MKLKEILAKKKVEKAPPPKVPPKIPPLSLKAILKIAKRPEIPPPPKRRK